MKDWIEIKLIAHGLEPMLSQYGHEEEVLFPPCTMMVVQGEPSDVSNSGRVIKDSAKAFLSIKVQPQFV